MNKEKYIVVLEPTNDITLLELDTKTDKLDIFMGWVDETDKNKYIPNHDFAYKQFQYLNVVNLNQEVLGDNPDFVDMLTKGLYFKSTNGMINQIVHSRVKTFGTYHPIVLSTNNHIDLEEPSRVLIDNFITKYNNGNKTVTLDTVIENIEKDYKREEMFINMQKYYQYCMLKGYVTPQEWFNYFK